MMEVMFRTCLQNLSFSDFTAILLAGNKRNASNELVVLLVV